MAKSCCAINLANPTKCQLERLIYLLKFLKRSAIRDTGFTELTDCVCSAAVPGGPGSIQTTVTRGDSENKEREEAEAERKEAESDREPQAPGQRPRGSEEPGVRGGAVSAACRRRGDRTASVRRCVLFLPVYSGSF